MLIAGLIWLAFQLIKWTFVLASAAIMLLVILTIIAAAGLRL